MEYGNKCSGDSMGDNAGKGNRAVAAHIKGIHKSGNAISSTIAPSKTLIHPPGAASSVLKTPVVAPRFSANKPND